MDCASRDCLGKWLAIVDECVEVSGAEHPGKAVKDTFAATHTDQPVVGKNNPGLWVVVYDLFHER